MTLAGTTLVPAARGPAVAAASHKGHVRVGNEDAVLARPESGMLAVADGMGGHEAGAEAARSVIEALAALCEMPPERFDEAVRGVLSAVNGALHGRSQAPGHRGMGSTVVVMGLWGTRFTCLWAGDSRAYRWRAGRLERLTADHSPLQSLIDAGIVVRDGNRRDALANLVSRAVGAHATLVLDAVSGPVEPGDRFLLCSDGLTKVVGDEAIAALLGDGDVGLLPHRLIEATLAAGAPDNVSVIIAEVPSVGQPADGKATDAPVAGKSAATIVAAAPPEAGSATAPAPRAAPPKAGPARLLAALGLCCVLALVGQGLWGPNLWDPPLGEAPRAALCFAAGLLAAAAIHRVRWTAVAGVILAIAACSFAVAAHENVGTLFSGAWSVLRQRVLG
ncbi:PP2C family protein-serine/threonine phosphatase [Arenibaculum pallidiluteum]|uniref:PP2C family protein-serine/threonine phosphatase n=1 Tax=Arenibaculum pallidiluteum TaxID=2812559 RepID=UPI001A9661D6|nr:PP2C family serine/threonine-protein phosphatase [Arenibaculum pallidiluteum]